jgi:hypothetical protein
VYTHIKWQAHPEVLSSKIDNEAILMSIEADAYFSLEPVGSKIWELLSKEPATIDKLVVLLMEEFEVDEKTCIEDLQRFIDDMSAKKLIRQLVIPV